jgi:glycosyltransferase involved in cell wall biosynthesis/SAM-dependent methyltransferase
MRKVLVLTRYGRRGASSRVRFLQFLPTLSTRGMSFSVQPLLDDEYVSRLYRGKRTRAVKILAAYFRRFRTLWFARHYDLIWMEKEALPWLPAVVELTALRGTPYVVDFDDAWFHRYDRNSSAIIRRLLGGKIDAVMRNAAVVLAGNEYLANRARRAEAKRVESIPSVIDLNRYAASVIPDMKRLECKTQIVIGWIGTPITVRYLASFEQAFRAISAIRPVELQVVGASAPAAFAGLPVRSITWDEATEIEAIQSFDIGIMPLDNTEWERGKCAYKLLQVMAAGRPVVASPVGANCSIIRDGINGILAEGTNKWIEALIALIDHPEMRVTIGREALRTVKEYYTVERVLPRLSAILSEATVSGHLVVQAPAPARPIESAAVDTAHAASLARAIGVNDAANVDRATVRDFGREWQRFDQDSVGEAELSRLFQEYFAIFPWHSLPEHAVGFDAGCGSGRWAALVAPRVGHLYCVDASSDALTVAQRKLANQANVSFYEASLDAIPLADGSMDFGYSLGVLHHLPDPFAGLAACVRKLKPGAPMLVYIYYAFDNRPAWFRLMWRASDWLRRALAKAPFQLKSIVAELFAATIYLPLARGAHFFACFGLNVANWPLSAYRWRSYYSMRTDALDRFGTRLEHRMTKAQIEAMMASAGLRNIRFSNAVPFWCAVGRKM